jgi:hypothetical protein
VIEPPDSPARVQSTSLCAGWRYLAKPSGMQSFTFPSSVFQM